MPPRKEVAPELIAEGKRLYEQTLVPVTDIMALLGLTKYPFYRRVKEWGWRRRRAENGAFALVRALRDGAAAPSPADEAVAADATPVTPQQRYAMAQRIYSAVEKQMAAVEKVLDSLAPGESDEAERTARTLAGISRTLQELAALNQPDEEAPPDAIDDDPIPYDIDQFRNELARRINEFVESRRGRSRGVDDQGRQ